MFSLATPIACMTVGHDEEIKENGVGGEEGGEEENGGRNSRLRGG